MSEQQNRVYLKLDKKVGEMTDEELKEYSDEVYARIIKLFRGDKNGWRESNPHYQLGKLEFYHWTTPARS